MKLKNNKFAATKNLWTNGVNPCTPGQSQKYLDYPGNPYTVGRNVLSGPTANVKYTNLPKLQKIIIGVQNS